MSVNEIGSSCPHCGAIPEMTHHHACPKAVRNLLEGVRKSPFVPKGVVLISNPLGDNSLFTSFSLKRKDFGAPAREEIFAHTGPTEPIVGAQTRKVPFKFEEDPDQLHKSDMLNEAINRLVQPYVDRIIELEKLYKETQVKLDKAYQNGEEQHQRVMRTEVERDQALERLRKMGDIFRERCRRTAQQRAFCCKLPPEKILTP